MIEYLKKLVESQSAQSSARFINILGAFTGLVLLGYDTAIKSSLDQTLFGIYLAYCGGVYTASKGLGLLKDNKDYKDAH